MIDMSGETRGVTGSVSGTPFAIDADEESILDHDDIYDNDNDGNNILISVMFWQAYSSNGYNLS